MTTRRLAPATAPATRIFLLQALDAERLPRAVLAEKRGRKGWLAMANAAGGGCLMNSLAPATKRPWICGMLGRDPDAERAAAPWHATRRLRDHGLPSWPQILSPPPAPRPMVHAAASASPCFSYVAGAQRALRHSDGMTAQDVRFQHRIGKRWRLPQKQHNGLHTLIGRLQECGAA
ncbi:hypothetical protein [Teichococcus oryzae]|uniref:Uncharacterized protein n=1 Tax=Teichococcus oryzae TaxID=1608942 RepID=A0A5B2TBG2_9PROT|nr:hypothetical protein [Pseudoroseomonas oryzae]KAA2211423.1 hypothetical protein F0Q34_20195 [Pseudoroseomonas oryzae]